MYQQQHGVNRIKQQREERPGVTTHRWVFF